MEQLEFDFNSVYTRQPELLLPAEAARMLCVSERTIANKRLNGEIPYIRISKNRYRYLKRDIINHLQRNYAQEFI